jgi:hypothetical protein
VGVETVVETLAQQEQIRTSENFKLQMGFARTGLLSILAALTMVVTLFLTPKNAEARTYGPTLSETTQPIYIMSNGAYTRLKAWPDQAGSCINNLSSVMG